MDAGGQHMPEHKNPTGPQDPIKHPVIATMGLVVTGALVAAVLTGLAKGLAGLRS
jgi:hypothetical protein